MKYEEIEWKRRGRRGKRMLIWGIEYEEGREKEWEETDRDEEEEEM
jgi:hypothetical protein